MSQLSQFDVFISYSHVDKDWVIKLKEDLLRYKLSVWIDKDQIRPGNIFAKDLEKGMANSRAVALIVSPEAMASGWVEAEYYRALSLAQDREISLQLIPVILRETELPGFLKERLWVDFRDESQYSERMRELVWGITGVLPKETLDLDASLQPESTPKPSPRRWPTSIPSPIITIMLIIVVFGLSVSGFLLISDSPLLIVAATNTATPTLSSTPTSTYTSTPTASTTPTSSPLGILVSTATPTSADTPTPTYTPTSTFMPTPTGPPTPTPSPVTPSSTPTSTPTDLPTAIQPPIATNSPTITPAPEIQSIEGKVIYHDATTENGVGKYNSGEEPWIDLLVRINSQWFGPEREKNDDIIAEPLPEGYSWEVDGGFATNPGGDAWYIGPATEGTARLIAPDGKIITTLPITVTFHDGGGSDGGGGSSSNDGKGDPRP